MSMLPDDPESTILKRLKKPKPAEEEEAPAQQRSEFARRTVNNSRPKPGTLAG